ncbi:MAG: BlaI/MecI/CopY family transcriptional regulator [Acidobacteria bacterium]|nr:BlaI/MecI/CopY family transcriptional regulator [Acidobacteriota bacterium]
MRRGRTAREIPPPLELQCLCALWTLGEANVQAVRDHLAPSKPLAYTTVMTMLDRLTRKKVLTRRKVGRSFVYLPTVTRDEIRRLAVRELVDSLFDGDGALLSAYLSGHQPAPPAGAAAEEPKTLDAALL